MLTTYKSWSAMKLICTRCWLRIYCLATVESRDYQKFEWHWDAAWWWKRCALIACRVFAIAQTLIISMRMLQAICMQMRKSNRTQNYEGNRLWKSFDSVSCCRDDKNWDRTLSRLICWEWLAERTWITNIL